MPGPPALRAESKLLKKRQQGNAQDSGGGGVCLALPLVHLHLLAVASLYCPCSSVRMQPCGETAEDTGQEDQNLDSWLHAWEGAGTQLRMTWAWPLGHALALQGAPTARKTASIPP